MTLEELQEILSKLPGDIVSSLSQSSYTLPKWSDLEKEYDPMKHSIWNTTKYPEKLNENNQDDFKRTALALQKLAVNRVAQSMFSTPTQRKYNYDRNNQAEQITVDILEQIYKIDNYIDSENIERAKKLNASCQIATVWFVYEEENIIEGEIAKFKLAHKTYSEMDGYRIFPIIDPNGNLLVISIGYTDSSNVEHFIIFLNTEKPEYRKYDKKDDWILDTEASKQLEVFPVVYTNIREPIWGGEAGTNKVEQLEEMESYQGLYIKRNALPTFTMDYGEITGAIGSSTEERADDARRIIKVGKGGKMEDVTWNGADNAITSRYNRIRNAFFEEIQVPDISFANMINSNTSAENKELLFADAKAKARDLGGEWEKLFYDELEIVKKFAEVMFPKYSQQFQTITVRSQIVPYSIKTKKENAEYVATAGDSMSLETQVRVLGEVDDVANEVETIQSEQSAQANQGIL